MQERKERERANETLLLFATFCLKKFPAKSETEKFDNLRHCVFENSLFSDKKENTKFWDDKDFMAEWILNHAAFKMSKAPPMECSYRSRVLIDMLRATGYQAHSVVTASAENEFADHVVVELYNPDTKQWEIHDPSYDTKYYAENRALNLREMLARGPNEFYPCDYEGRCGWDKKSRENIPFSLASRYWNTGWVKREGQLYVSSRFDVNTPKKVGDDYKSYCEYRAKWCRNIEIIY